MTNTTSDQLRSTQTEPAVLRREPGASVPVSRRGIDLQVHDHEATSEAVQAILPSIAARVEEIEQARRIPLDLVAELEAAGCFRSLVPRGHGGDEHAAATHMRMLEELSRADGSLGWTVMIGAAAPVMLGLLPVQTFDAIYAAGPDVVVGGAFNPTGSAVPTDGGYIANGRWTFASGCQHSDWFLAHCIVNDGRMPPIRMMVVPASDVGIVDTWHVSGLRGTGSHDFMLTDVFVPEARTFALGDESTIDAPVMRVPELSLSTLFIAAVAIGIAQGALDDIEAMATTKVPAFGMATLAANPLFRNRFGCADAELRAARALVYGDAAAAWRTATDGAEFSLEQRARIRASTTWAVRAAATVVDVAYTDGGGSSMREDNPLQRRWRDVHAVTQHFAVKPDTFTMAGGVLAGQDVDTMFL
jgi:alkylation response protein AidB-like acyl-CoA dehydrogenase